MEDMVVSIRDRLEETHTQTQVINEKLNGMKEAQQEHKEEMHEAKEDIEDIQKDMNRAKGGIKIIILIGIVIGILAKLALV